MGATVGSENGGSISLHFPADMQHPGARFSPGMQVLFGAGGDGDGDGDGGVGGAGPSRR